MAYPTLQNSRVDKQVGSILQAYTNENFIADKIFPKVGVTEESGLIGAIDNSHLRSYNSLRALYDESEHRMEFKYTNSDRYEVQYRDLEVYLPDRVQRQVDSPFAARRDASIVLLETMKLDREITVANQMTSTTVITNNDTLSGSDQFSDLDDSNPEEVIQDAINATRLACLKRPNSMIIGYNVLQTLKRHPFFVNQYNGLKTLSEEAVISLIKSYFKLDTVLVGEAVEVTSNEGQTEATGNVWGNDIVLYYAPKAPGLFVPSFGYSFVLKGQEYRSSYRRHTNDLGDNVRVEMAYQDFILDTNSAYLIKDAV